MREFILNSEELLDREAYHFLETGEDKGLLPCTWIRFNDKIKLFYFTDGCEVLGDRLNDMDLDEICRVGKEILERIKDLEGFSAISLENLVWDVDSIYLNGSGQVFLLCLPAVIPAESLTSQIYLKRVYAILEEMLEHTEGGAEVCRQIEFQKERAFGNWKSLQDALERRMPEEDEEIVLKSVNTPEALTFQIGHEEFRLGSDAEQADGIISGVNTISPLHAIVGWNEISFYVMDMDSANGTFVNDQKIAPRSQVPIGKGSVLRFADCTFNVE